MRNSGKSMVPLPSVSTSLIISCSSASVGFWPRDRMTVPSSFVVMVPSPSLSNSENASLTSAISSAVTRKLDSAAVERSSSPPQSRAAAKGVWWIGRAWDTVRPAAECVSRQKEGKEGGMQFLETAKSCGRPGPFFQGYAAQELSGFWDRPFLQIG
ncbi:MAG: hypothetical protein BJ554DRAFT_7079 [Olpidium bornovanus]|uniref:Uncharacterized protein n=1 Tax=Olpidium bornovanus TaxID=278681 RepID=A0A8H7ZWT0_9FUNG|nr:MAG: hypothetical protein BJ554DRAFT_7079 [Olpidium bornovanus]